MAYLPDRLRLREVPKTITMKDLEQSFECPRCKSKETEEAGKTPWVDKVSKPAKFYSVQLRRCKDCGFNGDEEMFKVEV